MPPFSPKKSFRDALHMSRFLHRHKSAEFLSSIPLVGDIKKTKRSHSLHLSKRHKRSKLAKGQAEISCLAKFEERPQSRLKESSDGLERCDQAARLVERNSVDYGYDSTIRRHECKDTPRPEWLHLVASQQGRPPPMMNLRSGSLNKTRIRNRQPSPRKSVQGFFEYELPRKADALKECAWSPAQSPSSECVDILRIPLRPGPNASFRFVSGDTPSALHHDQVTGNLLNEDCIDQGVGHANISPVASSCNIPRSLQQGLQRHSNVPCDMLTRPVFDDSMEHTRHENRGSRTNERIREEQHMKHHLDKMALAYGILPRTTSKKWRNAHKNYFPPGLSDMPQEMVVQICSAHIRNEEAKRLSAAHDD